MFILDENIPPAISRYLRAYRYKVIEIYRKKFKGMSDDQIMEKAQSQKFTIITFDKHFADIIKYPPANHYGIILLKMHPPIIDDIIQSLENLFEQINIPDDLYHALIILGKEGFSIRK